MTNSTASTADTATDTSAPSTPKTASKNSNLHGAKAKKNDEFYTQLTDVELELLHYKDHFAGKTVYLNCDDPSFSAFWTFFSLKFDDYKLERLISTHYSADGPPSYAQQMTSGDQEHYCVGQCDYPGAPGCAYEVWQLEGDGDFRSDESIELLQQSDIVVTNPPFSLYKEYVAQLIEHEKQFVIIGNMNSVTYREIFPLIQENKIWAGMNSRGGTRAGNSLHFGVPESYPGRTVERDGKRMAQVTAWWFTNMEMQRRFQPIDLYKRYNGNEAEFPKYDNYDAIEVSRTLNIPLDYDGVMGVPISFLSKHDPKQFEIVKFRKGDDDKDLRYEMPDGSMKEPYFRILIRHGVNK